MSRGSATSLDAVDYKADLEPEMNDPSLPPKLLVLGGARSGKSKFAQSAVEKAGRDGRTLVFVATAHSYDVEMEARIAAHRAARDSRWRTVDAPYELADAIGAHATPNHVMLVDCLTLWLSNTMLRDDDVDHAADRLVRAVLTARTALVLVSNEVGGGIVPDHPLGRRFRDAQGRLNQAIAVACDHVVLVTAGLPQILKPCRPPDIAL